MDLRERIDRLEEFTAPEERIRALIDILNEAGRVYYSEEGELISNQEYDRLYDELQAAEEKSGLLFSDSPTRNVGYSVVSELPRERHASPMLSLNKTKDREELAAWLNGHPGVLSWKLDGLTIVLTYREGALDKAVTRGNGEVGEVITPNARAFVNLPVTIPFKGELVLRGEAVISYADFKRINEKLSDQEAVYKNPRNLCSGSVRQLDSRVTRERRVRFVAFSLVSAVGADLGDSFSARLRFLKEQGFQVVESVPVTPETVTAELEKFEARVSGYEIPSDGLVLTLEEVSYGEGLGRTAKFPRNAIAFKWADEEAETVLREMEWNTSRTGLINPIAVFDPVELEGTTVKRASVHNISIIRGLKLGLGDRITVYKANMIIPQIARNLTRSDNLAIPESCPVCGAKTLVRRVNESEELVCTNEKCPARKLGAFVLFAGRGAMDIDGLSEQTLEKFLSRGFIHEYADIFRLKEHREEIIGMEGFGELSFENLVRALERSSKTVLSRLLYALGIPGVGAANARVLSRAFDGELEALEKASAEELSAIEGVGPVMAKSLEDYFKDPENRRALEDLLGVLQLEKEGFAGEEAPLAGVSVVITGGLTHFANRDELKALILEKGGKVLGSVSSKTTVLINNDTESASGKNKKAKELGIEIVSEEEFLNRYGLEQEIKKE